MAEINAVTTSDAVLGQVLAKLRADKGLKQSDVANALGIGASTLSRIEKGESGLSTAQLRLAAKALSVTPQQILDMAEAAEKVVESQGIRIQPHSQLHELGGNMMPILGAVAVGGPAFWLVGPAIALIGGAVSSAIESYKKDKK